jgi:hypothetical protein
MMQKYSNTAIRTIKSIASPSMFFIILAASFFVYANAHAQGTMTGGGYTLNGGISVFNSELSGGGYSLTSTGDPIVSEGTGGGYTFAPTPFSGSSTSSGGGDSGGSSGSGSGGASGGATGAGYTSYSTTSTGTWSWPIFDTTTPTDGLEWIDNGRGVDTNFDGIPDAFASTTVGDNSGIGTTDTSQGEFGQYNNQNSNIPGNTSDKPSIIKKYDNDLGTVKVILVILFLACICFTRIIRSEHGVYRISRTPLAIFIDYIIVFHRTPSPTDLAHPRLRDFEMEGKVQGRPTMFILLDTIIVPGLAILCMVLFWPISWILTLIPAVLLLVRLILGKKIAA